MWTRRALRQAPPGPAPHPGRAAPPWMCPGGALPVPRVILNNACSNVTLVMQLPRHVTSLVKIRFIGKVADMVRLFSGFDFQWRQA